MIFSILHMFSSSDCKCFSICLKDNLSSRDRVIMDRNMSKDYDDVPLSQSNVSLKLADIQRRCSELIEHSDDFGSLSLEEPAAKPDGNNP